MPELPEVETIVRDLTKCLRQKTFVEIIVHDAFILRQPSREFIRRLKGQAVKEITRRGKAIIIHLSSGDFLIVQLMMTGQMVINGSPDRHTRITFNLSDNGTLLYNDQRRFGQLRVVERLDQVKHLNILGPEPFDEEFSLPYIQEALQRTDRPIKNILLDHTFVAGIGNIYACEILYRCQINPRRPGRKISFKEIQTLQEAIIEVLNEAIDHRGSSMRNYRDASGQKGRFNEMLSVYAREGLTCPRCRHKILRITQSGRSTFYCGHCQK